VLRITASASRFYGRGVDPEAIAYLTKQFSIPPIEGGRSDEPYDLGELHPAKKLTLKVGDRAPAIEAKTLDGKPFTLAGLKGKFVLLDFWATWCGPCIAELPVLEDVFKEFGAKENFALVSLSLDEEIAEPQKFVNERNSPWIQVFLGQNSPITEAYHVETIPASILIDPEGKIVAEGLRGFRIGSAVERALSPPAKPNQGP
jgi:thiol-disulfide isomerase/thioredoxin